MAIEESKDLSSLDELIGNLKVHEVVIEKDFEIYRGKKERVKSISLKAKKESSDDETLTSGSDDEEFAIADYLNDEYVAMTRSYFIQYTGQAIPEFHDTLIQHIKSVKKSIDERVQLKREYDSWVYERQMQTTEEKVDTSQALDASSVDTKSSRIESKEQDTSSRSWNDAHDDVADIRPIYDEEPMAEVQMTTKIDVFAIGQQHTEQPEFNYEGKVVSNDEECHDKCPLPALLTDNQILEHSYQSLEYENSFLKKTIA
nr:alpha/beta hydrolases superfamily protein [Tanacetum cinerariifolium]